MGESEKKKWTLDSMIKQMEVTNDEISFRNEKYSNVDVLKEYVDCLKCTKCESNFQKTVVAGKEVSVHPVLGVLMCTDCCNYYGDGNFSLGSDGEDKYCRWCGEGGTLFACTNCICGFCDNCIKKHFGEEGLKKVENDDDWICYFCDPKPLWDLRSICALTKEAARSKIKTKKLVGKKKKQEKRDVPMSDSSSDADVDSDYFPRRKRTRKSMRIGKNFSSSNCKSSSSSDEKTETKLPKKLDKKVSKNSGENSGETSCSNEEKYPPKKPKLDDEELDNESKEKLKSQKSIIVNKLKGAWVYIQKSVNLGLSYSRDGLKILEKGDALSLEMLEKECESLKSVASTLLSSMAATIQTIKEDINFDNLNDDREFFQIQDSTLKSISKKIEEMFELSNIAREVDKTNKSTKYKRKKKRERKESDSGEDKSDEDLSKEKPADNSKSLFSQDSEDQGEKEISKVKVDASENSKPLLKVKSFARMSTENVLKNDTEGDVFGGGEKENSVLSSCTKSDDVIVLEDEEVVQEKNSIHIDDYNADTEEDERSCTKKVKNSKGKKTEALSESDFSDEETPRKLTRRQERNKTKSVANFEKFREKRKKYLKSKQESQSDKVLNNEDGKKKLDSSDSDPEAVKTDKKNSKRKRIIASSDEENEGEKKVENDEGSNSSSKEEKNDDEDSSGRVSPKVSSGETSNDELTKKRKVRKKNGRKNIKKILKRDALVLETKEAVAHEEERIKRVEAREKLSEKFFPEEKNADGSLKRLVLDFNPETKEPLVTVHEKLVKKLKPHQAEGVKFMWNNCFESVEQMEESSGSGCILAHCMGLGKTLQIITLVHTVMTHDLGVNTTLVICPLSTIQNWINEFEGWLSNIHTEPITLYELSKYQKMNMRCYHMKTWHEEGGVMVISYNMFRTLTKKLLKNSKNKSKATRTLEAALIDPGPDLVVCDEGHLLKNEDSALSRCVTRIKTARRIVLTGTPLQNNLMEYHCMVQFVKPNILGTKKEFYNRFVNPINNGQFEDSTERDVRVMKRRSHVLHSMLRGCVQRFDYSVLKCFLPEKYEYVLSISLTDTQAKAYCHYIQNFSGKASEEDLGNKTKVARLFNDYHNLHRIWTHPRALLMHGEKESRKELMERDDDSEGSLKDFVVDSDESTSDASTTDSNVVREVPVKKRLLRSNANDPKLQNGLEEENTRQEWWNEFYKEPDFDDLRVSNKLLVLFTLLKHCEEVKDKVLVFSQSLYSLDLIEYFLKKIDDSSQEKEENELLGGYKDSWVLGVDYFRLDGSTKELDRAVWCKSFNKVTNKRARLFLISTRAGGLGINLYGANRVVVFDASWNPSHDLQSIFRVYRFGQKKTCYIYRFLAEATMEEKIYERQVTKLSLAHRVVDEHQIERHYTMMNLQELYNYEPLPMEKRKVPKVPKDTVLAEILRNCKDIIVDYHEHDSLLENQEEEELTEEERKAAWEDYEKEKMQNVLPPMIPQSTTFYPPPQPIALPQVLNGLPTIIGGVFPQFVQNPAAFMVQGSVINPMFGNTSSLAFPQIRVMPFTNNN